ncbi:MAG TPA: ATP synthase F1 subunit delta [Terriglobales bacterium]|jgi:F-type H+-transporting ATPase subunit delta|nr:ATP synthase F1 subunit delta [Terriglobales bacterium]
MASVPGIYARALADVVFDQRLDPGKTLQQAQSLVELVTSSRVLREVWETPSIPAEEKRGVLDAIAVQSGISRPVRNFMAVLIDHRRVQFLGPIVKEFEHELDRRLGFAEAEITSARELSDTERRALEAQVGKLTGKKVRARYSRDVSVLGGAMVRVGSTIYDGSVKGQMERIREAISS